MGEKSRVYITDFIKTTADLTPELDILGDIAEVIPLDVVNECEIGDRIDDADCVIMYHFIKLTEQIIARMNKCKLIVRSGVGYDNVDRVFARKLGIDVCNVPDYGTEEVADSAIAMTTTLARGTHYLNSRLQRKEGPWIYSQVKPVYRLRGRTFGVLGLGRIGTATAKRAQALGMRVIFLDPYVPDGWDKANGVQRVETLDELLSQSDVLSLHSPCTDETHGLINAEAISKMRKGAFLINTARGEIVETGAVPEAIRSGQLAGAGIDVLPVEPPADDDPLVSAWRDPADPCYDRVIIAPHAAFYCEEGLTEMRVKGAQACRKALLGEPLRNVVNGVNDFVI